VATNPGRGRPVQGIGGHAHGLLKGLGHPEGVEGLHRSQNLLLALDEVVADLEALVGAAHHADLLGGIEGDEVFLAILAPVRLAFRLRKASYKVPVFNESRTDDLIGHPSREHLPNAQKGVEVAGVDRIGLGATEVSLGRGGRWVDSLGSGVGAGAFSGKWRVSNLSGEKINYR